MRQKCWHETCWYVTPPQPIEAISVYNISLVPSLPLYNYNCIHKGKQEGTRLRDQGFFPRYIKQGIRSPHGICLHLCPGFYSILSVFSSNRCLK